MDIVRISAASIYGIPIEQGAGMHPAQYLELFWEHNLEVQEIEAGPVDITPPYWQNNDFRYMLSRPLHDEVLLELLPLRESSGWNEMGRPDKPIKIRTIRIPADRPIATIAGGSVHHPGRICIHEFIATVD